MAPTETKPIPKPKAKAKAKRSKHTLALSVRAKRKKAIVHAMPPALTGWVTAAAAATHAGSGATEAPLPEDFSKVSL